MKRLTLVVVGLAILAGVIGIHLAVSDVQLGSALGAIAILACVAALCLVQKWEEAIYSALCGFGFVGVVYLTHTVAFPLAAGFAALGSVWIVERILLRQYRRMRKSLEEQIGEDPRIDPALLTWKTNSYAGFCEAMALCFPVCFAPLLGILAGSDHPFPQELFTEGSVWSGALLVPVLLAFAFWADWEEKKLPKRVLSAPL